MFAIHVLYRLFCAFFVRFILGRAIFHFKLSLTHLKGRANQLKSWMFKHLNKYRNIQRNFNIDIAHCHLDDITRTFVSGVRHRVIARYI